MVRATSRTNKIAAGDFPQSTYRELAALKRMFRLALVATPPKVVRVPKIPRLQEANVRKGFLEPGQYRKLVDECPELWFRAMIECAKTYGWRISELRNLRVRQVDLFARSIRLEPGTTKNQDGREPLMTDAVYTLLSECIRGKRQDDHVFTRGNGKAVRDFRGTWHTACSRAGLGEWFCPKCNELVDADRKCSSCSIVWRASDLRYRGLILHDFRRTAARNLRRAGIAEGVIMKIGGWRTRSVFERYAIVDKRDIADAMRKLEAAERTENPSGLDLGPVSDTLRVPGKPGSVN